MAFQLAEAFVELNTKGFRGVMSSIGRVRSSMGSLVGFATGPLGVALAGLGAGAGVAGMVSVAASLETTEAQFKTLLGSADAAKQKMQELQKFSASTPFQFDSLADSAKKLLSFGTSNDQVIPTLKVLGDVAAATGNNVNELAGIYGKVQSRGALMTESLDQFNERGIPVGKKLAEMFGVTGAEIRQMASDGDISFSDLQSALTSMTSKGGVAFKGMAEQAGTLSGVWSTFKDNITILMGDIGEAIVEGFDLKEATESLTGFVQRVRSEWLPSIVDGFQRLNKSIIQPFYKMIGSMTEIVLDFVTNFDLYWEFAYTTLANHMLNMWNEISAFFENSVTMAKWFVDSTIQLFGNLYNNAGEIFPAIGKNIAIHFQNGVELAKWYASSTIKFFSNIYSNAGEIFRSLTEQIKNHWQSVLNFFKTGELNFDFSPLRDSFHAAIEGIEPPELRAYDTDALKGSLQAATESIKSPELVTAQTDLLQGDLDAIAKKLADRQQARRKRASEQEANAHSEKLQALKSEGDQQRKNDEERKRNSASFISLSALAEKMQSQLFKSRENEENKASKLSGRTPGNVFQEVSNAFANVGDPHQASKGNSDLMNRQVEVLGNILQTLNGAGVKVSGDTAGEVAVPPASVQFGDTA